MTSKEIKDDPAPLMPLDQAFWLKEIAYQLAVMNENRFKTVFTCEADTDPR